MRQITLNLSRWTLRQPIRMGSAIVHEILARLVVKPVVEDGAMKVKSFEPVFLIDKDGNDVTEEATPIPASFVADGIGAEFRGMVAFIQKVEPATTTFTARIIGRD